MEYPFDAELEQNVISYLLQHPHCLPDCEGITSDHFFDHDLKGIYSAFEVQKQGWTIRTLKHVLTDAQSALIDQLAKVKVKSIERVVPTLRLLALKRAIFDAVKDMESFAAFSSDVDEILKNSEDAIAKLRSISSVVSLDSNTIEMILERMRVDRIARRSGNLGELIHGYQEVDEIMGSLEPGCLHIIAARPGMGKTSYALNVIINCLTRGVKCAMFSLEMSNDQIIRRIMGLLTDKPFYIYGYKGSDTDYKAAEEKVVELNDKLYLYDEAPLSIDRLGAVARQFVANYGVRIIFIDYLQLVRSMRKEGNKVAEITEISNKLKEFAKSLNVPIVCLAQLNRDCEKREDKRPVLSDLRESGSIEQDADSVMFLYSDDYYNNKKELTEMDMDLIIAKNRHGPTGKANLLFNMPFCKFEDSV